MANLPVKWFDNRFHGIPPLNGIPGSMTALLDAILVNGFGDTVAVSVVVTNKIATIVLEEGVTFFKKSVVALSGISNQLLNTEYRVLTSDVGTLTIDMDVPDGVLTGVNIKVRYAPLGWFKPFSSVSKAIYMPSKVDALKWMFHVDDTAATYTDIKLCEDATSIDVLYQTRPTIGNRFWGKSYQANTISRLFSFIGDPYCLYYKSNSLNSTGDLDRNYGTLNFVGEPVRLNNALDPFAVFLSGRNLRNSELHSSTGDIFENYVGTCLVLRPGNGLKGDSYFTSSIRSLFNFPGHNNELFYSDNNLVHLFTDNFFTTTDRRIYGIPGLVTVSGSRLYDNFDYILEAKDNTLNRDLIFMRSSPGTSANSAPTTAKAYFFDITGPWR